MRSRKEYQPLVSYKNTQILAGIWVFLFPLILSHTLLILFANMFLIFGQFSLADVGQSVVLIVL